MAGLWQLLSTEFVLLTPIALHYAYRVPLYWKLFCTTVAAAVLLKVLTVNWPSIKAAMTNPVYRLKTE